MTRIVFLLFILVTFIGENVAQNRKKGTSKKKTKKEIVIEMENTSKKIRKVNLYLNFMKYNINSISEEYWNNYSYSSSVQDDDIVYHYQNKIRKTGSFSNLVGFGGGIRTYAIISSKVKFDYGLGVDLLSSIYDSKVEVIDQHLVRKERIITEFIYIPGETETLEVYPWMVSPGNNFYQTSDREEHNLIMLVIPLELRYNIYKNFDVTGGLVTRLPIFERRAFEVIYYDSPFQSTRTIADNGPLINRFLAFGSIGARFQSNKGFTVGLSYQHLLNSLIMKNSEFLEKYDYNNKNFTGSQINLSIGYSF
ncbi:MAG: hypothetical protein IPN86_23560 [Saprospiraceae bacterium]|nr:hypothetical protein [Saprospiraceae bacterium]